MKIEWIEAIPIRIPRDRGRALHTAGSPTELAAGEGDYRWSSRVTALYSQLFETALVKIVTDTGLVGWGEAQAPLAPQVACTIVELLLKPVLRGAEFDGSPLAIERLWQRMYDSMRVRGQTGGFMLDAIAGADIALWDLAGKMRGQSVAAMLGSGRRTVPAYLSGLSGATVAGRVAGARTAFGAGFRDFKLFFDCPFDELTAILDGVAEATSQQARVAVDALWQLTPESAVPFGQALDQRRALWLEAPLMPEDPLAHAELARRIRTPLALGESYRTRHELAPFFRENAMGFVQPDLGRCGLTETLRIAETAAQHGVRFVPHVSIAMGPQIAAAIHSVAAAPNGELLEYNPSVLEMANRFLTEPLRLDGAAYVVPDAPGLGIELCEAELSTL